jgi:hypothetical protein
MKTNLFIMFAIALAAAGIAPAWSQGPGGFDLTWNTVDGGGVMRSTGGGFELSGTIGQVDAGRLAGGDFELTGGFWFEVSPGDCNEDGGVTLFDVADFSSCILGPYIFDEPGPLCECFDLDLSATIDLRDFAHLQTIPLAP